MIVCYSFIWSVGLSYHGSRLLSWLYMRLPQCDSPTGPRLTHHKFLCHITDADEIHALRQIGHINLLGFSVEATRLDNLAHEVGNSEFGMMNAEC